MYLFYSENTEMYLTITLAQPICLRHVTLLYILMVTLWLSYTIWSTDLGQCPGSPPATACSSLSLAPWSGGCAASAVHPALIYEHVPWLPGCGRRGPQVHSHPAHLYHLCLPLLLFPLVVVAQADASVTPPEKDKYGGKAHWETGWGHKLNYYMTLYESWQWLGLQRYEISRLCQQLSGLMLYGITQLLSPLTMTLTWKLQ